MIWNSRWDCVNGEAMFMVYAYNNPENSKETSLKVIENDLLKLGIENPRLYQFKSWQQCPYVDTSILQKGASLLR